MKADRVLADADANTRRAYELRAARSEPGLLDAGARAAAAGGDGRRASSCSAPTVSQSAIRLPISGP